MEEDETPDVRNPDYADTIRHSDQRIRTPLQSARTMSLLFMEGKFEQAIEEATNTLIRCIEAIARTEGFWDATLKRISRTRSP